MSTTTDCTATECRIYVASLSDYNAGRLHGAWIDLDDCAGVGDIWDAINAMLAKSREAGAEEWAIHDYEGLPDMGENPDFEDLWVFYEALGEHGEAWGEYVEYIGVGYATVEGFEEAYVGAYDSEKDFAEQLVDDLGYLDEIPEHLRYYFDYEAFARDLFIGDYHMTEGGYVFGVS